MLPIVEGVVEEKLVVNELVLGTVVTGSLVPSEDFTLVCDRR